MKILERLISYGVLGGGLWGLISPYLVGLSKNFPETVSTIMLLPYSFISNLLGACPAGACGTQIFYLELAYVVVGALMCGTLGYIIQEVYIGVKKGF